MPLALATPARRVSSKPQHIERTDSGWDFALSATGRMGESGHLGNEEVRPIAALRPLSLCVKGSRLLVLVPDATRSAPLPMLIRARRDSFSTLARLDLDDASGANPPMDPDAIDVLLASTAGGRDDMSIRGHAWEDPATFATPGRVAAREVGTSLPRNETASVDAPSAHARWVV